mmetsp:Transcript_5347/g.10671  ORF Transcript_5347/g.10671 Transcript_5347/m.10671 type:complete len:178 (-) Transcript_5347:8-541(-)
MIPINILIAFLPITALAAITEEDVAAYKSWPTRTLPEKLHFLLYDEDWANLREEFKRLDKGDNNDAKLEDFMRIHSEYTDEEVITDFFELCQSECASSTVPSGDSTPPPCCDFMSYVIARGSFDASSNLYDNNEWEMRESVFLTSYQEAVDNPRITEEELKLLGIEVNEDDVIEGEL